jgi:formate dehydrogenase subunit gamma
MRLSDKQLRRRLVMSWMVALTMVVFLIPLVPQAVSLSQAQTETRESTKPVTVPNPGTDLWREVRQREGKVTGTTQMRNMDAGVLINVDGQKWRQYRMSTLLPYSAVLLLVVIGAIYLYWRNRGPIKIDAGRSGKAVPRFSYNQRVAHWTVAILFVTLGITGVIMLYGRFIIKPIFGQTLFGYLGAVAKTLHDFAGPLFAIALIVQFVLFVRGNGFNPKVDVEWLKHGGGMLKKDHVHAGCYNAGEKLWFWLAMIGGAFIIISGLVLDFPYFNQDRAMLELNHMLHSIFAVCVLAVSLGHIYLGTKGMEGAFEIMVTGYCDENWAKEHHDLWYEDMKKAGKVINASEVPKRGSSGRTITDP